MSYQPIISTRQEMVELRKLLGMTQTELAEALGMSLRAVQDIENGRAEFRLVHALALDRIATAYTVTSYVNGKLVDTPPIVVAARNHDQAARRVAGTEIVGYDTERGHDKSKLVAKVWIMGPEWEPITRWYFRKP